MDIVSQKQCEDCKKYFPATPMHFPLDRYNEHGIHSKCRHCYKCRPKQKFHLANPSKSPSDLSLDRKLIPEGMKKCRSCKAVLSATCDYFNVHKSGRDGLRTICKKCSDKGKENPIAKEKKCNKCLQLFPATREFFSPAKRTNKGDIVWRSVCRECYQESRKKYEPLLEGEKQCGTCLKRKPVCDFHRNSGVRDGLNSICKLCTSERQRSIPIEKIREYNRRRDYGISPQEYDIRFSEQGGACAVCRMAETCIDPRSGKVKPLSLDHNHQTKQNRGLLCHACNVALGYMRDDPKNIRALADYAELWQYRELG